MASYANVIIALLAMNLICMVAVVFMLFIGIPEAIDAAVSETRRNVYMISRGRRL